jgi:hypothetical protein
MPETITPAEEKQYRYRYLCSQWALVIVAIGGIFVAIRSLHSLNQSATAANRQAQAAVTQARDTHQQLELSERAAVYLGLPDGKIADFSDNGGPNQLVLYFRNYGASTAKDTVIEVWPAVADLGTMVEQSPPAASVYLGVADAQNPPRYRHPFRVPQRV